MNVEEIRQYCLSMKGVTEGFPFDSDTLVFKVMGKMFALLPLEHAERISLKCDPDYALELRERYPEEIQGAWHMNKKHWNMVFFNGGLPDSLVRKLVVQSYELVVKGLKKADREALEEME